MYILYCYHVITHVLRMRIAPKHTSLRSKDLRGYEVKRERSALLQAIKFRFYGELRVLWSYLWLLHDAMDSVSRYTACARVL